MHTDSPRPEWVHPKDSAAQDGWFVSLGGHDSTTEVPGATLTDRVNETAS